MKITLTLQEKLRDLRDERKLKLQDVADGTGIPLATLGCIESSESTQVSFENVALNLLSFTTCLQIILPIKIRM